MRRATLAPALIAAALLTGCGETNRALISEDRAQALQEAIDQVESACSEHNAQDAQQAIAIRRMVRDLDFPVQIEVLPTVREPDGLAMSSRNAYLSPEDRQRAVALIRALRAAEGVAASGETRPQVALDAARAELERAGIEPEYLEARDAEGLAPAESLNGRPVLVAVAARVGRARLIDNLVIGG